MLLKIYEKCIKNAIKIHCENILKKALKEALKNALKQENNQETN